MLLYIFRNFIKFTTHRPTLRKWSVSERNMGVIDCIASLQEEIQRWKVEIQFLWQRIEVKIDEKVLGKKWNGSCCFWEKLSHFPEYMIFRWNDNRFIGPDKYNFMELEFTGVWFQFHVRSSTQKQKRAKPKWALDWKTTGNITPCSLLP